MTGSKNLNDRIFLLNHVDKILFNSKWSQNRFFIGMDNKILLKQKTSVCYQSTSKCKINFNNKKKLYLSLANLTLQKAMIFLEKQ